MKAKRRAVTISPRVAEQKYPSPPKRPPTRSAPHVSRPTDGTSAGASVAGPVAADDVDLTVDLGRGLVLPNPILVASGTFGYGVEYGDVVDVDRLGGICCKGTTLKARIGNPTPRVTETPAGMLNSIGLQNPGVDAVIEKYAATWTTWKTPVLVNVAGESVRDYVEVARRLDGVPGVAGIELNISCPNVGAGGLQFAIDAGAAAEVTAAVRRATDLPLLVKLSPNVVGHPADRAGHRRRRRGRADRHQHPVRDRHRAGSPPAAARQHLWRPERPGGQAGRAADRLRGGPGRAHPGRRHRRRDRARRRARLPRGRAPSRSRSGPRSSPTRRCPSAWSTSSPRTCGSRRHDLVPDLIGTALPEEGRAAVGQGRRVPALIG